MIQIEGFLHSFEGRFKLVDINGFVNILKRSQLHGHDRCFHILESSDHDNLDLSIGSFDLPEQLDSINIRKTDVQNDNLGLTMLDMEPGSISVGCVENLMPLLLQIKFQGLTNMIVIINDEHFSHNPGPYFSLRNI